MKSIQRSLKWSAMLMATGCYLALAIPAVILLIVIVMALPEMLGL